VPAVSAASAWHQLAGVASPGSRKGPERNTRRNAAVDTVPRGRPADRKRKSRSFLRCRGPPVQRVWPIHQAATDISRAKVTPSSSDYKWLPSRHCHLFQQGTKHSRRSQNEKAPLCGTERPIVAREHQVASRPSCAVASLKVVLCCVGAEWTASKTLTRSRALSSVLAASRGRPRR
jgi:hypothetical protein